MSGSAPNRDRSQQATRMMLARYETLAKDGSAGTIVTTFLRNLAPLLRDELATAARTKVAGDKPAADAGLWERGVAWARGKAATVAGAAAGGLGNLLGSEPVLAMISAGVNSLGTLPLTTAHDFVCRTTNTIDDLFGRLHQVVHIVPGYESQVKPWVESKREALRDLMRAPVVAAIRFTGQLLQRAFAEQEVQSSSIARQIRQGIDRAAATTGPRPDGRGVTA